MAMPLMVEDQAVGVMELYAAEAGFFDYEELKLLKDLDGLLTGGVSLKGFLKAFDAKTLVSRRRDEREQAFPAFGLAGQRMDGTGYEHNEISDCRLRIADSLIRSGGPR